MESSHKALADLATQYWKLCESLAHTIGSEDGSDAAMLRYSRGRLDAILEGEDMTLRCYDGQEWTATLPSTPINADEFDGETALVERTLEPTILHGGSVLLPGKVMLAATQSTEE